MCMFYNDLFAVDVYIVLMTIYTCLLFWIAYFYSPCDIQVLKVANTFDGLVSDTQ